jgi:hypothetical protein
MEGYPPAGTPCAWCGAPATHLCTGCGKWICDAIACRMRSVAFMMGFTPGRTTGGS